MANLIDYLDWRGDLAFGQSPFNEVDNVILAQLSYVNMDGIVPLKESGGEVALAEAARRYFEQHDEERIRSFGYMQRNAALLFKKCAATARFADVRLSRYENQIDWDLAKQFAALHFRLPDGTVYVAFRGTDDTIIGWKENFHMSFQDVIPAQLEAVRYLEETAGNLHAPLRLGGHSKGGNLAVYAAVMCDPSIQNRIVEVYNNDGPGFASHILEHEAYRRMRGKIRTIVPRLSVVGMLLEHEEPQVVVRSSQMFLLQHDPLSWEVLGSRFVRAEQVAKESRMIEAAIRSWLQQLSPAERKQFVDNLFAIFEKANIRSVHDLTRAKWRNVIQMVRMLNQSEEHKVVLARSLKVLFQEGRRAFWSMRRERIKGD